MTNNLQLAGLKHFADLQEKMTAQEGSELAEFVKQQVLELFDWKVVGEDAAHVRQMGSYLRGKQRCSVTFLPPLSPCFPQTSILTGRSTSLSTVLWTAQSWPDDTGFCSQG